jgi:hypothetical protein
MEWKRLVYNVSILNILRPFGRYIFCPFGNLVAIWYIFPHCGILCQEKSGNPAELCAEETRKSQKGQLFAAPSSALTFSLPNSAS